MSKKSWNFYITIEYILVLYKNSNFFAKSMGGKMELHTGKYLNKDLAEWFGISQGSFNTKKEKKLEELKDFADFHLEGKKVVIDKVLIPIYSKRGSDAYQKIKEKIDEVWSESGLDSCSRVGEEIFYDLVENDVDFNLKNTTVYNYTIRGRNELYGKPFGEAGTLGSCIYTWCKKDEETGTYLPLSSEEQKIKSELQTKYFGDTSEKQILVKGMIASGEITQEEAWGVLEEMTNMTDNNFVMFLKELQDKIGCKIIKGTLVQRIAEKSAF